MSDDHAARLAALEQLDEDLFDFPDFEGMADLLAASRADAAAGSATASSPAPASSRTRAAATVEGEPKAPLPAPKASAPKAIDRPLAAPRNADDLDEDLFGFGEVLELGARNDLGPGDFGAGDSLLDPDPLADHTVEAEPPKAARKEPFNATPTLTAAPLPAAEPQSGKLREPKRTKAEAEPRPVAREQAIADTTPQPTSTPSAAAGVTDSTAPTKREPAHAASAASSPFLALPSFDLPPARSKLLWVLVGCFLLANGGVFLMTQQQNHNVNQTLVAVTSTLADAVARGSNAAPRDVPLYREPVADDVVPARAAAPMLDPADFSNTNELGLHNARRLIEQGAYAEARRNLFFILANQDRSTPLTPALREDIDYLIALTYYDQGRSIAVEEAR